MSGTLKRPMLLSVLFASVSLFAWPSDVAASAPGQCIKNRSLEVCVVSAALTPGGVNYGGIPVAVSVSIRFRNISEYPVGIALVDTGWSSWGFTPQNSETLMNRGSWKLAGVPSCQGFQIDNHSCGYATIEAGGSALAQLTYNAALSHGGLSLVKIASKASFSAGLAIDERGKANLISLDLSDFTFGNGISSIPG